jgi:hypothetical protein
MRRWTGWPPGTRASWCWPRPDGDPLLERLVGNLVANAIKYNEPGGSVRAQPRPGGGLIVEIDLPLASAAADH